MKKKIVYVLTLDKWCSEKTQRVYDDIEKARATLKREVKSFLKKLDGWEVDEQDEDYARIHLETTFFDKNTTWRIKKATMEF